MKAPLRQAGRESGSNRIRRRRALRPPEALAFAECGANADPALDPATSPDSGTLIHPDTHRGVYRSRSPGIIVPQAAELWSLLHLSRARAKTQINGRYGRLRALTFDDLERHLSGQVTLAVAVLSNACALFAALDVDAFFPELLPVVRTAALAIGGEDLYAAIFCTGGSGAGRGKVIVTFTEPVAASNGRKLARRLCDRVRASEAAQSLERHDLSAYPQEKSGGVVRILGRNAARGGPIEAAFSLDGESGFSHLCALTPQGLAEIVATGPATIAAWANRRIEIPWTAVEGTQKHYRWIVALAREALRLFGHAGGRPHYDDWLDRIKANSPELAEPSRKTKDPRNVLDHARERAWKYACEKPNSWEPLTLRMRAGIPRGVVRVYGMLVSYVREKGLRPERFAIDYERIGILLGVSKSTAYRWVRRAAEMGVIVIHDRGSRHTKGFSGRCSALGLVCRDQRRDEARAFQGALSAATLQRKRSRPERRIPADHGNAREVSPCTRES